MKVLVIGYGNPLREDDGIGWRVVEEIENGEIVGVLQSLGNCQLETVAVHQLLPELAGDVSEAELVIFVDASVEGKPGTIAVRELAPVEQEMGRLRIILIRRGCWGMHGIYTAVFHKPIW